MSLATRAIQAWWHTLIFIPLGNPCCIYTVKHPTKNKANICFKLSLSCCINQSFSLQTATMTLFCRLDLDICPEPKAAKQPQIYHTTTIPLPYFILLMMGIMSEWLRRSWAQFKSYSSASQFFLLVMIETKLTMIKVSIRFSHLLIYSFIKWLGEASCDVFLSSVMQKGKRDYHVTKQLMMTFNM